MEEATGTFPHSFSKIASIEVNFKSVGLVMGLPQLSANENGNAVVGKYNSWQTKHPSALDKFEHMMSLARGRKIAVFLDYDGTLSNIVPNPEEAFMTNKMRVALHEVARCFPTAIISGRCRNKVYDFVRLDNVYYAGSHGLDIAAPLQSLKYGDSKHQNSVLDKKGNDVVLFQPAQKYFPEIQKMRGVLNEKTKGIKGVVIEDNKFCISVHFRHVCDEDFYALEGLVKSVLQEYQDFRVSRGKMVFEIRPDIEWDKGHALEYLLQTLGFSSTGDVLPIYIGDDRTDEDAFKVIRNKGQGYPIVVSSTPKDTMASYSLRDPTEEDSKWKLRPCPFSEGGEVIVPCRDEKQRGSIPGMAIATPIRLTKDKCRLVEFAFSRCLGLDNPPAISMLVLGNMGLKNVTMSSFSDHELN